jgi:ABC-type uncharacterized transport system YnjBCD ATPase subunit
MRDERGHVGEFGNVGIIIHGAFESKLDIALNLPTIDRRITMAPIPSHQRDIGLFLLTCLLFAACNLFTSNTSFR